MLLSACGKKLRAGDAMRGHMRVRRYEDGGLQKTYLNTLYLAIWSTMYLRHSSWANVGSEFQITALVNMIMVLLQTLGEGLCDAMSAGCSKPDVLREGGLKRPAAQMRSGDSSALGHITHAASLSLGHICNL
jgi:hypothetical protein